VGGDRVICDIYQHSHMFNDDLWSVWGSSLSVSHVGLCSLCCAGLCGNLFSKRYVQPLQNRAPRDVQFLGCKGSPVFGLPVALRSFLNGTQVSKNTTGYELLLRAYAVTCGWSAVKAGGRQTVRLYRRKPIKANT
jgi:hypothetical protein